MSKLDKLFKSLQIAQEALNELDSAGVDIDRLVGISNSQGPQGKVIKGLLGALMGITDPGSSSTPQPKKLKPAPRKKKRAP